MFHSNNGGFQIDYSNGWTVSVQWGAGTYGDNHTSMTMDTPSEGWESRTAEVASWRTNARYTEVWYDGYCSIDSVDVDDVGCITTAVRGHMDVSEVMDYMRMISVLEDIHQPIVCLTCR